MATGKKTFIFYSDWINMVREMPDDEAGKLLKHILSYVNDENPISESLLVRMAFGHMKPLIKSDLKKWELIREKRKKAGAKGGKTTQANAKQNKANAKQVQAVNDNVNVSTYVDYKESVFLENWSTCREHYLKQPTNIKNLNFNESNLFNEIKKEYSKDEINDAMQTLFQQERIPVDAMVLRPKHFLEKFDTYYTGKGNTKIYGSNV